MSNKIEFVVSGCLAGLNCRYDGGSNPCGPVVELYREGRARVICPETLGGLKAPRLPCEQCDGRVISRDGQDLTAEFEKGAEAALALAVATGCRAAILKSRSPSCGFGRIYDGSFRRVLCDGYGIWARKLLAAGFTLHDEEHLPDLVRNS